MPILIGQGGLLLIGSDFYNPSIMYMGGACETWKWAILDVRNIIARPSAKYACSWSNNTNSWKFAITTLKAHARYFGGSLSKICHFVSGPHAWSSVFLSDLSHFALILIGFIYTTHNFATFSCFVKVNANLLLDGSSTHIYSIGFDNLAAKTTFHLTSSFLPDMLQRIWQFFFLHKDFK
jgi:hypothetical protein